MEESDEECRELLRALKNTAEGLLASHTANVWSVYGGLGRLHTALLKILQHGISVCTPQGDPDCWSFVEALQWLQPSLATSPPFRAPLPPAVPDRECRYSDWLYRSLESHSLSCKLSWLLSDTKHVQNCYTPLAFLSRQLYAEAALICLRAVEQGQPSLLADLDPHLYLSQWTTKHFVRSHRRCSSFPDNMRPLPIKPLQRRSRETRRATTIPYLKEVQPVRSKFQQWASEPCLSKYSLNSEPTRARGRSATMIERRLTKQSIHKSLLTVNYNDGQASSSEKLMGEKPEQQESENSIEIASEACEVDVSEKVSSLSSSFTELVLTESAISAASDEPPQRPTNLSLSYTTTSDTDKVAAVRRSSDTALDSSQIPSCQITSPRKSPAHHKMPSDPPPVQLTPPKITPSYTPSSSLSLSPPFLISAAPGTLPFSRRISEANSFLASSGRFSDPAEELGRENAHFSVSEAMIAAIEHAKCERQEKAMHSPVHRDQAEDTVNSEEEDDEVIAQLRERIRARRREKEHQTRVRRALRSRRSLQSQTLQSDGRTDTATPNTTTDMSDPPSSTSSLESEVDESRDIPVEPSHTGGPTDNLARLRDSGLSVSMASLYSESELAARQNAARLEDPGMGERWTRSAEGVAWGLLRQFSGRALPRDSQLQWLVSEQDAPQQLLPLPSSWPVSPDEAEDEDMSRATQLRGTLQWAPPRAQIIFTPHPAPNRRVLMAKQGYLCAGCGMKVQQQYANKFRYCEYLGRYFCTGCHGNQLAVIPGKVLAKWDFTRCPVSSFAYRLLEQMQSDALFRVEDLNDSLFRKSRKLAKCKLARIQVSQLHDFVMNCRFATHLHDMYRREPVHITRDPEHYSMKDLIAVNSGDMLTRLQELVTAGTTHVANCELCTARGFVCELCHSHEVIFPWDVMRVVRCQHCGSCVHRSCWKSMPAFSPGMSTPEDCPRCVRLKARRSLTEETIDEAC